MSFQIAIAELRPDLNPAVDYVVGDRKDGKGVVIMIWDDKRLGPPPTEDEIRRKMVEIDARPKVKLAPPPSPLEKLARAAGLSREEMVLAFAEVYEAEVHDVGRKPTP